MPRRARGLVRGHPRCDRACELPLDDGVEGVPDVAEEHEREGGAPGDEHDVDVAARGEAVLPEVDRDLGSARLLAEPGQPAEPDRHPPGALATRKVTLEIRRKTSKRLRLPQTNES